MALLALGNWRDFRPTTTLLTVARDDPDPAARRLAVQSATAKELEKKEWREK